MKKNLQSVAASLSAVAAQLPTQHVQPAAAARPVPVEASASTELVVQFSFGLRKSQRRELQRLAADADMTMRAFILSALKERGLTVTEEDLLDLRRKG
ncbi:hypothetical protein [Rubellimicrobium roseum]|uniref:Uncharacterized protein n=1 Tax=Rubellimicrobium roseum TaxID=687525 RepID=A0A5C4N3Y2_9RHOB|nr:hypothetical protein [Rubellimicrobium roseum]TNC61412.1 hypothetical protein FHG71_21175 [Rubellimicrobium roseum]